MQALAAGKIMDTSDHTFIAQPICDWAIQHNPMLCLKYLQDCSIVKGEVLYSTPTSAAQQLVPGVGSIMDQGTAAYMWDASSGAVKAVVSESGAAVTRSKQVMEANVVPLKDLATVSSGKHGTILASVIRADLSSAFFQLTAGEVPDHELCTCEVWIKDSVSFFSVLPAQQGLATVQHMVKQKSLQPASFHFQQGVKTICLLRGTVIQCRNCSNLRAP
jgi:hypothetical protein